MLQATHVFLKILDNDADVLPELATFASLPIIDLRLEDNVILATSSGTVDDAFWQLGHMIVPNFVLQAGVPELEAEARGQTRSPQRAREVHGRDFCLFLFCLLIFSEG